MSSKVKTWTVTEPYLDIQCELGEGPYYEAETNTLRFVDIKTKQLHTVDLAAGPSSLTTLQLDMPVSVTANIEGIDPQDKILVGGKSGIYLLERQTGKYELLQGFCDSKETDQRLRSNDGVVDPQGRFWIGTMNDFWVGEPQSEGALLRFNSDLTRHTIKTSLTIPNGIGWSLDHKTLYFTHTTERRIIAHDYSASDGALTNARTFWQLPTSGEPDGFKVDADGYIWLAVFGEGRVLRISPQGEVVGEIKYPTKAITCPVFIGTELWVTSADGGVEKYGGGVFKVDVGIGGLKPFNFRLEKGL
ncbi:hypothetical protein VE04_09356 [Pseudogymnoascus sp. 24MN13]|nr:hypothetical protein VE04_09356 [Pseudogymnoascus sp. 24MN13]